MVNMNAQQIIKILKRIKKNRQESYRKYSDERYFSEMPYYNEIFILAEKIEPYNEGENRAFFFWTDRGSYDEYVDNFKENFIEMTEEDYINNRPGTVNAKELKEKYQSMFPEEKVCFYVKLIIGDNGKKGITIYNDFCFRPTKKMPYDDEIGELLHFIYEQEKITYEMIKENTYTEYCEKNVPYEMRTGYCTRGTYWKYFPEKKKYLFGDIDPDEYRELETWTKEIAADNMTSGEYFQYASVLYDILGIKEKYPIKEFKEAKDYYLAYCASHYSIKRIFELDEDDPKQFRDYIENGTMESHRWDVCLAPIVTMKPVIKENGKIVLFISLNDENYKNLLHICLELRKRGVPVARPTQILQNMREDVNVLVQSWCVDYPYFDIISMAEIEEQVKQPLYVTKGFEKEVTWLPVFFTWDPDYTKVTAKERELLEKSDLEMKSGDFVSEKDFWS